jgi:hypothetical protein
MICGNEYYADLYVIPMRDIVVILGMDWLSNHGAQIDCGENRVAIREPGGGKAVYQGDNHTRMEVELQYHPQTGGQTERTNQILEDMLRDCALDFGRAWNEHLLLVEFSHNNSYQSSIKMAPFKALYGRKCRSPI